MTNEPEVITFTVKLPPMGKGRPRAALPKDAEAKIARGERVRPVMFTPSNTRAYEARIREEYRRAFTDKGQEPRMIAESGPVAMTITAMWKVPQSWPKKNRPKTFEVVPAAKKSDLDNMMKAVCDALNGVAYTDDKQVTWCQVTKVYGTEDVLCVGLLALGDDARMNLLHIGPYDALLNHLPHAII